MKFIRQITVLMLQILISVDQAPCSTIDEDQKQDLASSQMSLSGSSELVKEKSIWGIGEEQLDELFNSTSSLICLADAHYYYRINHQIWEQKLGYSEQELLSRPYLEIINKNSKASVDTVVNESVDSISQPESNLKNKIPIVTNFDVCFLTKQNCEFHLRTMILLQTLGFTDHPLLIGIGQDITLQKQAIEQKQDLEQAQLATRMKSSFVAHMSHELRTPLNGIIGFLDLALEEELSESLKSHLTHARQSAGLLLEIADNIVDVSRLEAGRLTLQSSVFNPIDSLTAVIHSLKDQAAQKSIYLKFSTSASMPTLLQGDSYRFQQILSNLGSNAVKYTQQGKVSIKLESYPVPDQSQQIMIRGLVKDTGMGIKPLFIPKLFQPFSQEDQSMKRDFGGTGLGLYLTKELCEKMGGSIHVLSTPDFGSTFEFKVMMARAEVSL